uniref:Uncharacterized protein n=1 Tax=Acrobeloides nanus TaxID=290746 RepID=A0A914E836_9BILA
MVKLYGKHIEVFKGEKLADEIIAEAISEPGLGSCSNVASSIYGYDDKISLQLNETYLLCGNLRKPYLQQNAHGEPYLQQNALFYPNIPTVFPNWQKDVPESLKKILRKKSFKCPDSN